MPDNTTNQDDPKIAAMRQNVLDEIKKSEAEEKARLELQKNLSRAAIRKQKNKQKLVPYRDTGAKPPIKPIIKKAEIAKNIQPVIKKEETKLPEPKKTEPTAPLLQTPEDKKQTKRLKNEIEKEILLDESKPQQNKNATPSINPVLIRTEIKTLIPEQPLKKINNISQVNPKKKLKQIKQKKTIKLKKKNSTTANNKRKQVKHSGVLRVGAKPPIEPALRNSKGGLAPLSLRQVKANLNSTKKPKKGNGKKALFNFLIGLILSLILALIAGYYYVPKNENQFTKIISQVIPYPAIIVNGATITYKQYLEEINAIEIYLKKQQESGIAGVIGGLPGSKEVRTIVIKHLIRLEIIHKLAKQNNITASQEEIDAEIEKIKKLSRANDSVEKTLKDLYGWSVQEFGNNVIKPYLIASKLKIKLFPNVIDPQEQEDAFNEHIEQIKRTMKIKILVE